MFFCAIKLAKTESAKARRAGSLMHRFRQCLGLHTGSAHGWSPMGPLLSMSLLDLSWCRQVIQWSPHVTCCVVAWQMSAILCCCVLWLMCSSRI